MARRLTLAAVAWAALAACATTTVETPPAPRPFPAAAVAGRPVALYPLTSIVATDTLGWDAQLTPRMEGLRRADSLIGAFLEAELPEVQWVLPPVLRAAAGRAPGLLADPDRMATAVLRAPGLTEVPDPLRGELRNLTGTVADRYAVVPARLAFVPDTAGLGRAELSVVLVDVRNGVVVWRTLARGEGTDSWSALRTALRTLLPEMR